MRTLLIFNPASGTNRRAPGFREILRAFAARHSTAVELAETNAPGHAVQLARAAAERGCDCAAAVGGDGTANEVAQGLIGTPCALGFVPRGSGNGLARHLGIPLQPLAALRLFTDSPSRIRPIDTGTANGRVFINVMGCGFDADLAEKFSRSTRRGFLTYVRLGAGALRGLRAQAIEIEADGTRQTREVLLVAVANSPQYGNGAEVAPGAQVDDGRLDLVSVGAVGALSGALLATRLFRANFDRHPRVQRMGGTAFVLRRASPGFIHTDGEPHHAEAEIRIAIRRHSLGVVVPAA